ncbi:hypothetical protein ACF0H5_014204 [Mactra antiquata]
MTQYAEKLPVCCRRPRCTDIDLTSGDPKMFVESQIPISRSYMLILVWNIVWFTYFTTSLFCDVFYFKSINKNVWMVSLSNWSFIFIVVTIVCDTCARVCAIYHSVQGGSCDITWYQKIQWILNNINNVLSIIITILYFSFYTINLTYPSVCKHLITSIYVILSSAFVTAIPVKLFHFYQPMVFIIIYAIFLSIYQSQIKTSIFLVLDWTEPRDAAILLSCVILIGCPLIHTLFYFIFKLRTVMFTKCSNRKQSTIPSAIKRDVTATDVILEDGDNSNGAQFIDLKPDIKDDIGLKSNSSVANGDISKTYNSRMFKSETDLRDYRTKNGLYCDFARSSFILHPRSNSLHVEHIVSDETEKDASTGNGISGSFRGSQIIVVKKCKTCENNPEDDDDSDDVTSRDSDASSDFLSQYITEDILSYL